MAPSKHSNASNTNAAKEEKQNNVNVRSSNSVEDTNDTDMNDDGKVKNLNGSESNDCTPLPSPTFTTADDSFSPETISSPSPTRPGPKSFRSRINSAFFHSNYRRVSTSLYPDIKLDKTKRFVTVTLDGFSSCSSSFSSSSSSPSSSSFPSSPSPYFDSKESKASFISASLAHIEHMFQSPLLSKLEIMALKLSPMLSMSTGEAHPSFPKTLLQFWLLTEDQIDELAAYYHQSGVSQWSLSYPSPVVGQWVGALQVPQTDIGVIVYDDDEIKSESLGNDPKKEYVNSDVLPFWANTFVRYQHQRFAYRSALFTRMQAGYADVGINGERVPLESAWEFVYPELRAEDFRATFQRDHSGLAQEFESAVIEPRVNLDVDIEIPLKENETTQTESDQMEIDCDICNGGEEANYRTEPEASGSSRGLFSSTSGFVQGILARRGQSIAAVAERERLAERAKQYGIPTVMRSGFESFAPKVSPADFYFDTTQPGGTAETEDTFFAAGKLANFAKTNKQDGQMKKRAYTRLNGPTYLQKKIWFGQFIGLRGCSSPVTDTFGTDGSPAKLNEFAYVDNARRETWIRASEIAEKIMAAGTDAHDGSKRETAIHVPGLTSGNARNPASPKTPDPMLFELFEPDAQMGDADDIPEISRVDRVSSAQSGSSASAKASLKRKRDANAESKEHDQDNSVQGENKKAKTEK